MKYKLIKTTDYILVVDDSEIKDVRPYNGKWHLEDMMIINKFPTYLSDLTECKLIIAHLPLNGSAILEGVDLLPPIEDDVDVDMFYHRNVLNPYPSHTPSHTGYSKGFETGYNKAREKFRYTEEDVRKAFNAGLMNRYSRTGEAVAEKEFIQSLSQYPTEFECEMVWITSYVDVNSLFPKTTTNAQGQRVWVGKYNF